MTYFKWSLQVKILGRLHHTNVVELLGYSNGTEGRLALVYELLEGGSLDKWLRNGQSAPSRGPALTIVQRYFRVYSDRFY
jgi:serine/threonine protein kinase